MKAAQRPSSLRLRDHGISPAAREYRDIAPGVAQAIFGNEAVTSGWQKWRDSLGTIDRARFYSLPGDLVRYEIAGATRDASSTA